MRLFALLVLCSSVATADTLTAFRERLASLQNEAPLAADVTYTKHPTGTPPKPEAPFSVAASVTDSQDGLSLTVAKTTLLSLLSEERKGTKDADAGHPVAEALGELKTQLLHDYLHASDAISLVLDQASLEKDEEVTYEGQPARLLTFKVNPPMNEKSKKYLKEFSLSYSVWTKPDLTPIAAERLLHLRGRALLVISFEQQEKETYRFALPKGRLIIAHSMKEGSGSGAGESNTFKSEVNLTPTTL